MRESGTWSRGGRYVDDEEEEEEEEVEEEEEEEVVVEEEEEEEVEEEEVVELCSLCNNVHHVRQIKILLIIRPQTAVPQTSTRGWFQK
ncbi:hypothetical protein GBF38_009504 [Nibea albiflora]|uniref:Uncharacterized protein n=1 Tax=Nibea albiflora TaxID=240163 RepID=A0ACB7FBM3_NIBAL|nr:hypothetical protein GBF38_009504 [Nibea albiflora]